MEIENFTLGPFETNAWLLTDATSRRCVLVDAPPGAGEAILPEIRARGLTLEALLLTHGHWDHMADAHHFAAPGTMVCAHRADAGCFGNPEHYAPWYRLALPHLTEADFQPVAISHWVEEGGTLSLLGKTWEVRHVPGHCPGNVLFFCAQAQAAFPGDAIFAGSVGRSDLPGGNWPVLLKSIRERIYTLPDATALYPGHGSPTRVGDEKRHNPYARPLPTD